MSRVSPERIFKSHHPRAVCIRYSTNGGDVYFLVFLVREESRSYEPCGEGDTKSRAWADACKRRGLTALKVSP